MKKTNDQLNLIKLMNESSKGFSLIEILVAITLLGIVGTITASKIFDSLDQGKVNSCKIQIESLAERLKEYRKDCGQYPTTEQGLDALVSKPSAAPECKNYAANGYIDKGELPKDSWDHDFVYESSNGTFDIYSFGLDGEDGTADDLHYDKKKAKVKAKDGEGEAEK